MCAGSPHNSRQEKNLRGNFVTAADNSVCHGDSGGPLLCSVNGMAILMGVLSLANGCGEAGKPAIYAKVDFFNGWLQTGL